MKAICLFVLLSSLAPVCLAQDAIQADSAHYSVILENEHVRVLDIHYGPYSKGNMHGHPCSVTVFLTDGNLRFLMPDGKTLVGTVKAGETVWENAGGHQPENLTDKPFHAVRTELKNPQDCTKPR